MTSYFDLHKKYGGHEDFFDNDLLFIRRHSQSLKRVFGFVSELWFFEIMLPGHSL
jgi:hypothetical protein